MRLDASLIPRPHLASGCFCHAWEEPSLIPRPFPPPVFDRMLYAAVCNQKLEAGTRLGRAWEQDYIIMDRDTIPVSFSFLQSNAKP